MGTALSQDIRDRFAALYAEGHTAREIGRRLMISAATGVRFATKLRKDNDLIHLPNPRRTGDGKLVPYEGFFAELVEQAPDITLRELQAALLDAHGVTSSTSGIDDLLRRLGFTYKKESHRGRTSKTPCETCPTCLIPLAAACHCPTAPASRLH